MKITKRQLKRIIKEELGRVLNEEEYESIEDKQNKYQQAQEYLIKTMAATVKAMPDFFKESRREPWVRKLTTGDASGLEDIKVMILRQLYQLGLNREEETYNGALKNAQRHGLEPDVIASSLRKGWLIGSGRG